MVKEVPLENDTAAIVKMKTRLSKLETAEGRKRGTELKPNPTDVIIVTPPKCGTTWVQQIVHALRSNASMDFDEVGSGFLFPIPAGLFGHSLSYLT